MPAQDPSPATCLPVQLHLLHDWGGGAARWVADYCRADRTRRNLILKPVASVSGAGRQVALFADLADPQSIACWDLQRPILATAAAHQRYRAILRQVVDDWGVRAIVVSSLVGHSLDALATGLPTAIVMHDYYPFCPAVHICYRAGRQAGGRHGHDASGTVCTSCPPQRLAECLAHNQHNRFFPGLSVEEALDVRERFVSLVQSRGVSLVAPSPSVGRHLLALEPRLAAARLRVIPHGIEKRGQNYFSRRAQAGRVATKPPPPRQKNSSDPFFRPTAVVLGRLSPEKGLDLLAQALPGLTRQCDVVLLGCGESGRTLERPGVTVIPAYDRCRLPELLAEAQADFGLLLSIVPETFSYTLSELWACGVPPVAVNRGSFADRIDDGATGFLIPPSAEGLLDRVDAIVAHPELLAQVRRNLAQVPHRSLEAMVAEHQQSLPLVSPQEGRRAPASIAVERLPTVAAGPQARADQTFEELLDGFYAAVRIKAACTPRLRPWQRGVARFLLAGGYKLAKLGCRLAGRRNGRGR
jgi:glycosyltransferase involved in cell wall biosynthesis